MKLTITLSPAGTKVRFGFEIDNRTLLETRSFDGDLVITRKDRNGNVENVRMGPPESMSAVLARAALLARMQEQSDEGKLSD